MSPRRLSPLAALLLLSAVPLPAAAQARKAAIVPVALEPGLQGEAIQAGAFLQAALAADARVAPLDLLARARGTAPDAPRAKADEAAKVLAAASDAFDEMEFDKAVSKARAATALYEESDLREAMPGLLDSVALEALGLLAQGKKADARNVMGRVHLLSPEYKWKAGRLTPEASKAVDEVRAKTREHLRGTIEIKTSPVPALIYVDGVLRGTSPVVLPDLIAGNHYLTAFTPGYALAQQKGFAGPDGAATLALAPLPDGLKLVGLLQDLRDGVARSPAAAATAAASLARWAEADEVLAVGLKTSGAGIGLVGVRADAAGRVQGTVARALVGRGDAARPDLEAFVRELMAASASQSPAAGGQVEAQTGRSESRWVAGWSFLGGGVAVAAVGVGLGISSNSLAQKARDTVQTDTATYNHYVNSGKAQGYAADALCGVGAAAGVAGVILLIMSGASSSGPAPVATIAPTPGGAALALSGTF